MPPKNCFAITIAKKSPIITIHIGIDAGTLNAKSIPVTIAERSPIVLWRFITLRDKYSNTTQAVTDTKVIINDLTPKMKQDAISDGINAIITSSIMLLEVCLERKCGEALTVSFCFISLILPQPPLQLI